LPASQAVAHHIPYLRRYARALTGAQASGDAYVAATLEALVEDPSALEEAAGPKVGLYRSFARIWNSLPINDAEPGDESEPADKRLTRITPLPRQAFLLVALEGFDDADAAAILGVDKDEIRSLIADSGREMAQDIASDVMIIEDEPVIAMELENLVEGLGHRVTGIARTHAEAISLANEKPPGVILADIRLADESSGLDAVSELLQSFEVPAIFITAYPERFLTGDRPEPTFLIVKPFQPSMVSAVLSQALFFDRKARPKGAAANS
jgi:DNA-directed RNA polymerase specialized sigma24 family protein